jgi:putative toxin-antitoxin system antitoxin component (TIGR02293 family)
MEPAGFAARTLLTTKQTVCSPKKHSLVTGKCMRREAATGVLLSLTFVAILVTDVKQRKDMIMGKTNSHSILKTNGRSMANDHKLLAMVRKGVPKSVMFRIAKELELRPKELATILQVSERTLQRLGTAGLLSVALSSRVVQLALVYERGLEIFGDKDTLRDWLRSKSAVFGETPIELLDTPIGTQMVLDEMGRIAHGVYI